jgi:cytochrome P450
MDPINAATDVDPYPYYASLRADAGLAFHEDSGLWVASNAQAVAAILAHPDCRVRPAHESVPKAIAAGPAGKVFGHLMRMNEGEYHRCPRHAVEPGLALIDELEVTAQVEALFKTIPEPESAKGLSECMFRLPVSVVASLLGFAPQRLEELARLTADFVACLSLLSSQQQLDAAHSAAEQLMGRFEEQLIMEEPQSTLLDSIRQRFEINDSNKDRLVANLIGLLSQTFEATAGLIGNAVIALIRDPQLHRELRRDPTLVSELLAEVQRHDPSVQNTRRFVATRCTVDGVVLNPGDVVLVLLASANRDPQLNPDPDAFTLKRPARRSFTFGAGRHQCPGQTIALRIASAIVAELLQRDPLLSTERLAWHYRPSLNGRIPLFTEC